MYLLSAVPSIALTWLEVFVAIWLRFQKKEKTLKLLKKVIALLVVASGIGLAIDTIYFNDTENLAFDIRTLISSAIWLAYFYKSKRVHRVFVEQNWEYSSTPQPPPRTAR